MIKVGDKFLSTMSWGHMGITREKSLALGSVRTVAAVTKAGLITLDNGGKIREVNGRIRDVPFSHGSGDWLPLTAELQTEREAAIRLLKLRQKVGTIKWDTLTEAQCVGILAALEAPSQGQLFAVKS